MKKLAYLFFLLIASFSCTEDGEIKPSLESFPKNESLVVPNQMPTLENGILKFKSDESLDIWISNNQNFLQLNAYLESKKFESLENLYSHLVDIENIASDSLMTVFEKTKIMPSRVNAEFPIHSKKIEPFLKLMYFYPEGGFIPFASSIKPGIEKVLNIEAKVYIGSTLYQYIDNKVLVNGKTLKTKISFNSIITPTEYIERHQNTIGDYRTITDISYVVKTRPWQGSTIVKEYTVEGTILLRNFRNGLFGWNTRKTTSLRIEGELDYGLSVCPEFGSNGSLFYQISNNNDNFLLTSNGSSTTSIQSTFTLPTNNIWINDNGCWSQTIKFSRFIAHNLIITGENNNVSNFNFVLVN
jgi:hypothetical protein